MNPRQFAFINRRFFKILIACALIVALLIAFDVRRVIQVFTQLHWLPVVLALALFVPQVLVSAVRWRGWIACLTPIGVGEAVRQTLAASALNLVLPAKLGDLSKAGMLPVDEPKQRATAMYRATAEKLTDVAMLALFVVCGAVGLSSLSIAIGGAAMFCVAWITRRGDSPVSITARQWMLLLAWTAVLWTLHLAQLHLFLHAAGVTVPWETTTARMPLAIFAGLLPVSFCGIGTRDAALVTVFSDIAPAAPMLVVGMLTALRYFIPGAVGIALLGGYLPKLSATSWRGPKFPSRRSTQQHQTLVRS